MERSPRRYQYRLIPMLAAAAVAFAAAPAGAHAVLVRSDPPANASLASPPSAVTLWFSEPVAGQFSRAEVLDREGKPVGQSAEGAADGRQVTVLLGTLPRGVYTVRWRVLSAVDGHTTTGFFAFAVGEAVPAGLGGTDAAAPNPARVLVRWAGLLAALTLAGTAFFQAGVLRSALASLGGGTWYGGGLVPAAAQRFRRLSVVMALVVLVSAAVEFAMQASELLGMPLLALVSTGIVWSVLGGTQPGWSALLRVLAALTFLLPSSPGGRIFQAGLLGWIVLFGTLTALAGGPAALAGAGTHTLPILLMGAVFALLIGGMALIIPEVPGVRVPAHPGIPALGGAVLLGGVTLGAHAAGRGVVAVLADWAHLIAAALWVGGLASLLLVLNSLPPEQRSELSRALVPRFSRVAGISLGVLVVTGLYATWLYVPDLPSLWLTPYGQILLVKLLLIVPLLALGALNRFVLVPRFRAVASGASPPVSRLGRLVSGELAVVAAVLVAVAALTITPPARQTMPVAGQEGPLVLAGLAGDVRVRLTLTPGQPGWHRYEVTVDGAPAGPDTLVFLQLTKIDEGLAPIRIPLGLEQGRYAAEGGELGLPGWWMVEVVVRRRGQLDVSTAFPLRLGGPTAGRTDPSAAELLDRMTATMSRIRSFTEAQQVADGAGNVAVTRFEMVRPDRLRLRTADGTEAMIIGRTQHIRIRGAPWVTRTLPYAFDVDSYVRSYTGGAQAVTRAAEVPCDDEPCAVVLWDAPGGTTGFAAWVGLRTFRMHRLLMLAPSHHMTSHFSDFNADLRIEPPR